MEEKKLYIKNMVCDRCVSAVKSLLDELQIGYSSVTLGEVVLSGSLSAEKKEKFRDRLLATGFVLIDDKRSRLIVQVKSLIIDLVHYHSEKLQMNLSDYLSGKLHLDYHYISDLFSEVTGYTIEKYFIAQKVERIKELLVYDELSLTEIADQLNYSSVAHLSAQFKKITGLTPTYYKKVGMSKRKPLDEVLEGEKI
jgi:AraC-like DNA-binding protein/copper chaperone CopZ